MMAFVIGALVFYRWWRSDREIQNMNWKIKIKDLDFTLRKKKSKPKNAADQSNKKQRTPSPVKDKALALVPKAKHHRYTTVAKYKGKIVAVKKIWKKLQKPDKPLLHHVKELLVVKHVNLSKFVGMCVESKCASVLWEYCPRGSLQDVLDDADRRPDGMLQIAFAIDIISGLEFLHASPLKCHGNLTSSNCVVDSRWLCKLTDFGLRPLRKGETECGEQISEDDKAAKLFWLAPELLRTQLSEHRFLPTQPGDIFAFGVILKQILYLNKPYSEEQRLTPKEIIEQIAHPKDKVTRPSLCGSQSDYPAIRGPLCDLTIECWDEVTEKRPTSKKVLKKLKRLNPYMSSNVIENTTMMMESYTEKLEALVSSDTDGDNNEIMYTWMPRFVSVSLKSGTPFQTTVFESVSVCFTDIVDFTDLACESTPKETVDMLASLYKIYDNAITNINVHKVETVGDACMLVSGVPEPNGDNHVTEIADASLSILKAMAEFDIPHRPWLRLKVRIGMHSGPGVAGVVGLTMPRYCLFGDTVNTASRMESNGMPMKIHMSPASACLLKKRALYRLVNRGSVHIKGKGKMVTYWLQGKLGLYTLPKDTDNGNHCKEKLA